MLEPYLLIAQTCLDLLCRTATVKLLYIVRLNTDTLKQ